MKSYKERVKEGSYYEEDEQETSKQLSTFEREMQNTKCKASFEQEYEEFALQELLAAMSQGDEKSVRALAKAAGLHPNAIQNLRSGKTTDINCGQVYLRASGKTPVHILEVLTDL